MTRVMPFLSLLLLFMPAQTTLTVGSVSAAPGTLASGSLEVPARAGDTGTTIPITVINGTSPGPRAGARRRHPRHGVRADHRAAAAARDHRPEDAARRRS